MSIQIKRGMKKDLPQLKDGELAFCRDTKELYVGSNGNENVSITKKIEDRLNAVDSQLEHNINDIELIKKQYINVKLFDCKGDGITDDTLNIQKALSTLENGGVLFFPPGSYVLNNALNTLNSDVTLLGCGESSKIIVNDTLFNFSNNDNMKLNQYRIEKLKLFKDNEGSIINISYDNQSSNQNFGLKIQDCFLESNKKATAINVLNYADLDVNNCNFIYNKCCLSIKGVVNSRIINSTFSNNIESINIVGDSGNKAGTCGCVVSNCTIIGNEYSPILENGDYLKIDNCIIDYNKQPLKIKNNLSSHISNCYIGAEGSIIEVVNGMYNEITDCRITNYESLKGTVLTLSGQCEVKGCYFTNANKHIQVNSPHVNIRDCYFSRTNDCISVNYSSNFISILSNNTFEGSGDIITGNINNVYFNNNIGYNLNDEVIDVILPANTTNTQVGYKKIKRPKSLSTLTNNTYAYINDIGNLVVKTIDGSSISTDRAVRVSIVL